MTPLAKVKKKMPFKKTKKKKDGNLIVKKLKPKQYLKRFLFDLSENIYIFAT